MERRIAALEERVRLAGCATCRDWHKPARIEVLRAEQADDLPHIPRECPDCGKPTPTTIRAIVIKGVELHHDLEDQPV